MNQTILAEVKTICQQIAAHPKCPTYARDYVTAMYDGRVEQAADQYGTPIETATSIQINYIAVNMNSVKDKELKAFKVRLLQIDMELKPATAPVASITRNTTITPPNVTSQPTGHDRLEQQIVDLAKQHGWRRQDVVESLNARLKFAGL